MESTQLRRMQTDGAIVARGLFDLEWIETLRDAADEILAQAYDPAERLSGQAEVQGRASDSMWRRTEPFARFLFRSPIASTAAKAMGARSATLYEDLFLYTEAGEEGAGWHRDSPHWPVVGAQMCSVWFSLEPVTREAGSLSFVAGSHLDSDDVVKSEGLQVDMGAKPESRPVLGWETEPGDAVLFHPRVLHAALGAAPDRPRRTFTVRFAGDDVRWQPRRAFYHSWMRDAGLAAGDRLDHPWFPLVYRDAS